MIFSHSTHRIIPVPYWKSLKECPNNFHEQLNSSDGNLDPFSVKYVRNELKGKFFRFSSLKVIILHLQRWELWSQLEIFFKSTALKCLSQYRVSVRVSAVLLFQPIPSVHLQTMWTEFWAFLTPPPPMWTLLLNSCYKVLMSSEQPPLPLVCSRGLYTPPYVQCCRIVTLKNVL